jgi:hypothetical protein
MILEHLFQQARVGERFETEIALAGEAGDEFIEGSVGGGKDLRRKNQYRRIW